MNEHIPDKDSLYRRIHVNHFDFRRKRITSAAFFDYQCRISVDWSKYRTPSESIKRHPTHSLGELKAKTPREVEQEVLHRPSKKSKNNSHSEIIGNQNKSVRRYLARNSKIIINNF